MANFQNGVDDPTLAAYWAADGNAAGYANFGEAFTNEFTGNVDWERTLVQNAFNASQAQLERNFNAAEASKNREFQRVMSNTAYQRAVEDARRAGLNPYTIGIGGASTPSGSSASSGSGARGASIPARATGFSNMAKMLASVGMQAAGLATNAKIAEMGIASKEAMQSAQHAFEKAAMNAREYTEYIGSDGEFKGATMRHREF